MDAGENALVGFSNRQLTKRWQHSGLTISLYIHETITAMLQCKRIFFSRPEDLPADIRQNSIFYPYFQDCIGALNGCLIAVVVPQSMQLFFEIVKGLYISQNILGVVDFDMTFVYNLVGWEGSGYNGNIFSDAKIKGLPLREGKYWLGDAGAL